MGEIVGPTCKRPCRTINTQRNLKTKYSVVVLVHSGSRRETGGGSHITRLAPTYKTSGAESRIRSRNYFITQIVVGSVVGGVVVGGTVVGEILVGDDVGENVLLGFDGVCVVGVC